MYKREVRRVHIEKIIDSCEHTCAGVYLEHGVCEEGLQHSSLAGGIGLILFQQLVKVSVLLAVG